MSPSDSDRSGTRRGFLGERGASAASGPGGTTPVPNGAHQPAGLTPCRENLTQQHDITAVDEFADHWTFIGSPLIRLRGGATGMCSLSGAFVRFS